MAEQIAGGYIEFFCNLDEMRIYLLQIIVFKFGERISIMNP